MLHTVGAHRPCVSNDPTFIQPLQRHHATFLHELGLALERQAEEHHRLEEEKKRESRSFQVSQDVLRHLRVPDKLEILEIARYHCSWTDAIMEASKNRPIILRSMAFLLENERKVAHHFNAEECSNGSFMQ